jgi:hypothetical protein
LKAFCPILNKHNNGYYAITGVHRKKLNLTWKAIGNGFQVRIFNKQLKERFSHFL